MSVTKLFWTDPYCTEISASVTSVDGDIVTLDQTIAYAFSGGQQSDSGTIGGYQIVLSRKDTKEIYYTLEPGHALTSGQKVKVAIGWDKRFRLMRLHFAAEIILELVYQSFGHPQKIGANITEDKARVDFAWNGNISDIFSSLLAVANDLIAADLPIVSAFDDEATEQRYWHIEGFAKVPCGGTHLRRTSEVGTISLKRKNIGAGKERIEILLES